MQVAEKYSTQDLKEAASAFAQSRKSGGKRARYPHVLMDQARDLLRKYPIDVVSETLGVSIATLNRWMPKIPKRKSQRAPLLNKSAHDPMNEFIEIPAMPVSTLGIEICLKSGVTIRLPSGISPEFLVEICRTL